MAKISNDIWKDFQAALRADNLARVRAVVEKFNINLAEDEFPGNAPLSYVVQDGSAEIVAFLLDAGADPNGIGGGLFAPLSWAVMGNKPENVELLLARGADVQVRLANGSTALMQIARSDNPAAVEIAQILLAHGIDIDVTNNAGETARKLAAGWNAGVGRAIDAAARERARAAEQKKRRLYARAVPGML